MNKLNFKTMPFFLVAIIVSIALFGSFVPIYIKELLYSVSFTIKQLIVFCLPIVIFCLLLKAMLTLSNRATGVMITILVLLCCSNFIATFLSRYIGMLVYNFNFSLISHHTSSELPLLFQLNLPQLIQNDKAVLAGLACGILLSLLKKNNSAGLINSLDYILSKILNVVTYLIPFFIIGFLLKLQHEGLILQIIHDYTPIFLVVVCAQVFYITLAYLVLNRFSLKETIHNIKNMLPAAISGLCTMSSAASMPLTLIGVADNAKNKDLARSVVPLTVNIHLIGDCLAIPIFAYACIKGFGMPEPSIIAYLIFTFYFVIAKFSVAAIPGGGIIVMLPILQEHLGFNSEMMSLITTLYILFDPIVTSANVLGNGAFAKMVDSVLSSKARIAD